MAPNVEEELLVVKPRGLQIEKVTNEISTFKINTCCILIKTR